MLNQDSDLISAALGHPAEVRKKTSVGGGSINDTFLVETNEGKFFVKENQAGEFHGMFDAEIKGLQMLRSASSFIIPKSYGTAENHRKVILVMEELSRCAFDDPSWHQAGVSLARLHRNRDKQFGLDHDNYIGSLPQKNTRADSWAEFYASERILPLVKMAYDDQRLSKKITIAAENFCSRIGMLFPEERPSLLHGDLWSGNIMNTVNGPSIFDPAVYYGHREMDLAMTRLFGGFDSLFYDAYCQEFPPEKGWEKRTVYAQLYPVMVHVCLFGGGYVNDASSILQPFA